MFEYKPALLGARCQIRVDDAGAEAVRGTKRQRVRFADVTVVRWLEIYMRTSSVSLVLLHRDGKFAVSYGGRATEAAHNADAAGFVAASAAILEGLARARPDLEVRLGGGAGLRWTMAVMGGVMAMLGALMALIPFGQGNAVGEGIVVVLMAMLVAFGGVGIVLRYNPLKPLPAVNPDALALLLRRYLPEQAPRPGA